MYIYVYTRARMYIYTYIYVLENSYKFLHRDAFLRVLKHKGIYRVYNYRFVIYNFNIYVPNTRHCTV
jgi:hypothetical protein